MARRYDPGTREVYERIMHPTKEYIERYGVDKILKARKEITGKDGKVRDDGRNEGRGWDEIVTEDERRLVRPEDVEQEIPPIFGPLFGSWKITVAFFLVFAVLALYWVYMQGWFASDTEPHSHGHAEIPASLAKHAAPTEEKGYEIGSPKSFGSNTSWLRQGAKDDSKMVIKDGRPDGITAVVFAYGCGRDWYTTDRNGFWNNNPGVRETNCNLLLHQTGQKSGGETRFGTPSYHRD